MPTARFRIDIEGEPFLLRSAVFRHLCADPRLDVFLVPSEQEHAAGDVLGHLHTTTTRLPAPVTLTVSAVGPLSLRRLEDGISRPLVYESMPMLTEALIQELSSPHSTSNQKVTGHA